MSQSTNNGFLDRLSPDDFCEIAPFLERVELQLKQVLIEPSVPVTHVWFPVSGMLSVVAHAESAEAIEVGLIGREGMTDHLTQLSHTSVLRTFCQLAGSALSVKADQYLHWIGARPDALQMVLRYQQTEIVQLSYTALSHGSYNIEERLARWLLMSFDRSGGEDLPLVHEFISLMLAVRRSGVTTAIHVLEGFGAIKATRGHILLKSRSALESLAAGSYGVPEAEYLRLMGPLPTL